MVKGIIVVDIPTNCYNCLLKKKPSGMSFPEDTICLPMCRSIYEYKPNNVNGGKPDWCPIKPIPPKQNNDNLYDDFYNGFDVGWNECLDEILKELK